MASSLEEALGKNLLPPLAMSGSSGGSGQQGMDIAQMTYESEDETPMKRKKKSFGAAKKYAKGGSVSSASKRADGCAQRGKTRGTMR